MTIRYTLRPVRNTASWGVPAGDPGNIPPDLASQARNLRPGGLMSRYDRGTAAPGLTVLSPAWGRSAGRPALTRAARPLPLISQPAGRDPVFDHP